MAKHRKRKKRKRHLSQSPTVQPDPGIPVTRKFAKIVEPHALYSIFHTGKANPRTVESHSMCLDQIYVTSIKDLAEIAIDDYGCDFHAASKERMLKKTDWDWSLCQPIYNDFSYKKMGSIALYQRRFKDKNGEMTKGIFMIDGLHRCVSLACLLLQDKIEFQPIPVEIDFYGKDASIP